jgi:hypothetical protein
MTPNNIVDGYGHFEGMWGLPSHRRGIYIYVYKVHNTRTRETKITAKFNSETNNSCLSSPSACCVRYVTKICKELELNGKHKLISKICKELDLQGTYKFLSKVCKELELQGTHKFLSKICKELELSETHKLLMFVGNIFLSNNNMSFRKKWQMKVT